MAAPPFSLGLWRARSGSGPLVVPDPLKAPDEVSNRRVECLDDLFGRGYGSKAYYNMQEGSIYHGVPAATRRKLRVSPQLLSVLILPLVTMCPRCRLRFYRTLGDILRLASAWKRTVIGVASRGSG